MPAESDEEQYGPDKLCRECDCNCSEEELPDPYTMIRSERITEQIAAG